MDKKQQTRLTANSRSHFVQGSIAISFAEISSFRSVSESNAEAEPLASRPPGGYRRRLTWESSRTAFSISADLRRESKAPLVIRR